MKKHDRIYKKRDLRARKELLRRTTSAMICWQMPRHRLINRMKVKQRQYESLKQLFRAIEYQSKVASGADGGGRA